MYQSLGSGSYASIYRYLDQQDSDNPIKVVKRNVNSGYDYWSLISEYDILQVVNGSPYIIKMLGCVHKNKLNIPSTNSDSSNDSFNIILESGDINLAQWITRYNGIFCKSRFYHIKRIMLDVALGLNQLHYSGIVHRDLKVCNILLFRQCTSCKDAEQSCAECVYRAKIIDFGLSTFDTTINIPNVSIPLYRAPECYVPVNYNTKIDIWAFAVCLYVAITGVYNPVIMPNQTQNIQMEILSSNCVDDSAGDVIKELFGQLYLNIYNKTTRMNLIMTFYNEYGKEVPMEELEQLVDLITGCMRFDVDKRLSITEVCNHPWFSELNDDILLKDSKREEQVMTIHNNEIRIRVMKFANSLLQLIECGNESRYSYRELIHGITLFDRVHSYMIKNELSSPSPDNVDVNNLTIHSRMMLLLAVCIYISFKYFTTSVDGVGFKSLFNAKTNYDSIARLEYDIIVNCLNSQIYYTTIYELSHHNHNKLLSALRLIMDGDVCNNLKPSQVLDMC